MQATTIPLRTEDLGVLVSEGGGRDIVLIHGAGGNAASWSPVADRWREKAVSGRLLAIDLPGRGESTGTPRVTVADLARVVADGIELLGLTDPILLGHSLGGAIALQVALDRPRAVAGLVLVSSGARLRVSSAILEAVASATQDAPFPLGFAFHGDAHRASVEAYTTATATTPVAATAADWRACDGFDVRDRLAEVRVPSLVVYGRDDALTPPKHQERLVEGLPRADRIVLTSTGHMLPWERPTRLAEAVGSWRA